jgi:RNA polymerase sigma-70 factor (family 1)
MNDKELLGLLSQGDEKAFKQLYDRYWQKMYAYALRLLNDTEQSEDLLQDVFISLWERKRSLDIDNLSAYLFSSVRYAAYNQLKQRNSRDTLMIIHEVDMPQVEAADHILLSTELQTAYEQLLENMPAQRKRIFKMRYEEDLTTRSIAEHLQIAQKTVQNHLFISYQQIRSLISTTLVLILALLFRGS